MTRRGSATGRPALVVFFFAKFGSVSAEIDQCVPVGWGLCRYSELMFSCSFAGPRGGVLRPEEMLRNLLRLVRKRVPGGLFIFMCLVVMLIFKNRYWRFL